MGEGRPELNWPSNTAALPNSTHPPHGLVPSLAGYPPSGLAYSPTVPLPTPPPSLLPALPVSGGVNGLNPNFNLSLNINPRLLGPAHMAHPLTSLINSLHGLNKAPASTALSSLPPNNNVQQQQQQLESNNKNITKQDCNKSTGLLNQEKIADPPPPPPSVCSKSAFHQVTPSLNLDENSSKSDCSNSPTPSTNSISPTREPISKPTTTATTTSAPASITTTPINNVNQPKTVWRPYWLVFLYWTSHRKSINFFFFFLFLICTFSDWIIKKIRAAWLIQFDSSLS